MASKINWECRKGISELRTGLCTYVSQFLINREDAYLVVDETIQEAFEKHSLDEKFCNVYFLYGIVRNKAKSYWKKQRKYVSITNSHISALYHTEEFEFTVPVDYVQQHRALLQQCTRTAEEKQVFVLAHSHQLGYPSHQRIAKDIGLAPTEVKNIVERVKYRARKLKQEVTV